MAAWKATSARAAAIALSWAAAASCRAGSPTTGPMTAPTTAPSTAAATDDAAEHDHDAGVDARAASPSSRAPLDGRSFPEHVLALTYDDGPDAHTLELARYLHARHAPATFFVVREWVAGVSSDPGEGARVFETGHAHLPILGELVRLGHRLGNHTEHHALLHAASARVVRDELGRNQRAIDPLLGHERRLFRAPGGAWSASASAAVDGDATLATAEGPLHWDVDRKDWESSLACRSGRDGAGRDGAECEPARPITEARVKPTVVARRYLETIESARRGVVLLHDRVGHVGSGYALDLARALVPELEARGYVFAAPVLRFSPLVERGDARSWTSLEIVDVDGDGRGDVCGRAPSGASCLRSLATTRGYDRLPHTIFVATARVPGPAADASLATARVPGPAADASLADVDGDGRLDRCERGREGIACARGLSSGFGPPERWSTAEDFAGDGSVPSSEPRDASSIRFADLNGDGRADVCGRTPAGLACALSNGRSFLAATVWCPELTEAEGWPGDAPLALGDVNGDGRADVCARRGTALLCGLAP